MAALPARGVEGDDERVMSGNVPSSDGEAPHASDLCQVLDAGKLLDAHTVTDDAQAAILIRPCHRNEELLPSLYPLPP